jgi:DNA-binding transcriptional regulator YdaS (Cro superfamily)
MKLDQYLRQYKVTATDFAIVLGVHVSQVSRWASGERVPSLTQAAAIKDTTRGRVTYDDFVNKME